MNPELFRMGMVFQSIQTGERVLFQAARSKQGMEAWFKDLAGCKPLAQLSRKVRLCLFAVVRGQVGVVHCWALRFSFFFFFFLRSPAISLGFTTFG